MSTSVSKAQLLHALGPEKCRKLEQRLGIKLDSDITIAEIQALLIDEQQTLYHRIQAHEQKFKCNQR